MKRLIILYLLLLGISLLTGAYYYRKPPDTKLITDQAFLICRSQAMGRLKALEVACNHALKYDQMSFEECLLTDFAKQMGVKDGKEFVDGCAGTAFGYSTSTNLKLINDIPPSLYR